MFLYLLFFVINLSVGLSEQRPKIYKQPLIAKVWSKWTENNENKLLVSFSKIKMFFAITLVLLALLVTYLYKTWFRVIYITRKMDGFPGTLPIIGDALLYRGKTPHEVLQITMKHLSQTSGNVKFWLGPELIVFLQSIKDIEVVLSSSKLIEKGSPYKILHQWLREGLLTSTGTKWSKRRKIITPAFHFKILEKFVPIFDRHSNVFVNTLEKYIACEEVELYKYVTLSALDIICESAMGVCINAQSDSDSKYVRAVNTISRILHMRMFDIFYKCDYTFKLTKLAREQDNALGVIHNFTQNIIKSRRRELLAAKENREERTKCDGSKNKMTFLDILLQSEIDGKSLSDLDIQEEVDTFMFEGHDTTSAAITFCLYNLGRNPEAQRLCFDEIRSIFGNDTIKPATYEDLCKLHYMELCVKETLRMFPPVPIIARKVNDDININGTSIPAGCNIAIAMIALGMNPEIFPQPEKFQPERFEAINCAETQNPFVYIPFSAGPRNCIGKRFAMLEVKSIVSKFLRHYEVEVIDNDKPKLVAELILKSQNALKFRIKRREV